MLNKVSPTTSISLRQIAKREIQLIWKELKKVQHKSNGYIFEYIKRNYHYAKSTVYSILGEDLKYIEVERPSEAYKIVFGLDLSVKLNINNGVVQLTLDLPTYHIERETKVKKRKSVFTGTKTFTF